jgi:hypothetical protein
MSHPFRFPLVVMTHAAMLQSGHAHVAANSTVRFVSFPPVADSKPFELLFGEGKTLEIEIPSDLPSDPYQIPCSASWTVGKSRPEKDGKPQFTIFGTAPSLASSNQLILLVSKGPTDAGGIKIIPLDFNSQLGDRMLLFFNMAREEFAAEIGGVKFSVKPGAKQIISPKADRGKNLYHADLYYLKEKIWKPFFFANRPLDKTTRGGFSTYADPANSRLKLHAVDVSL